MTAFLDTRGFRVLFWLLAIFIFYQSWIISHDKDLDIFIEAARLAFAGEVPYGLNLGTAKIKYYYSPFFLMLLYPLKDSPQLLYGFLWTACNYYLVFRILQLLLWFFEEAFPEKKQRQLFIVLCLLSSIRFILDNLGLGQMTILLVWASLEVVRLWLLGKTWPAGLLLALVINIKLIPIAILCYFAYTGSWRAVIATLLCALAFLMAPMVAWGYSFNLELHERWLQSLTGTAVNSIVLDDNRPGISSWIPSLLMERPMMFSMRRNFVSLDPAIVQVITNSVRVLFVLAGILLISRPLKRPAGKIPAFYDLAVICLLTPLVFPHQGKYALLYTLPAYAICISYLLKMPAPVHRGPAAKIFWLVVVSFVLMTLTTDAVITMQGSNLAQYLHLLTYGAIALLGAIWQVKRQDVAWLSLKP